MATQVEIESKFNEFIAVKIRGGNSEILVCCIYRSPNSNAANDKELCEFVTNVNKAYLCPKILVGDFNFPSIDWQVWSTVTSNAKGSGKKFLSCLRKNFLMQFVDQPTRARGTQTPHILDLIISNEDIISNIEYLSPIGKSDHSVLVFSCNWRHEITMETSHKLNYSKGDYTSLRDYMNIDWDMEFAEHSRDVNECWQRFKTRLNDGIERFIPQVKSGGWKKKQTWSNPVTPEMRKNIRKKHRAWTRFQETRDIRFEKEFKHLRNLVRKESRKREEMQQRQVAQECKNNPKKFWRYVGNKTKVRGSIGDIEVEVKNGQKIMLTDDDAKAEALNEYFTSIFTVEPTGHFEELPTVNSKNQMLPIIIDEDTILNKLLKLKIDKSPGPDALHPRILKEIRAEITYPLKHIFRISLDTGELPSDWRSSNIIAIFKKGAKSKMGNYRPVSLTCIICKVFESIIRDRMMEYFCSNELFSNKQYGFIKGRSTVMQLLKILDQWTACLEERGHVDTIYTDFEKAFDKVPHRRLLSKLQSYGVRPEVIKWIEGFLIHRQQRTGVRGQYSGWRNVLSGIPQGSVLGPLLFVIYINDLPNDMEEEKADLYLFADDAKIMKFVNTMEDQRQLQRGCNILQEWSERWLLKLNTSKCMVLRIAISDIGSEHIYTLNKAGSTEQLQETAVVRDLGVLVDNRLTFKEHIFEKVNKAYRTLGVIKRNFKHVDKDTFLMLYKSMVRCQLEYANSVWSPHAIGLMEALEKVQKRATRIIPVCRNMAYEERLKYLKLPTLVYRRHRGDMIEVYKILHGIYDKETSLKLERNECSITRGHSMKLKVSRSKHEVRKWFFSDRVVNVWNSLEEDIVTAGSVNAFKNRLDKFWLDQEVMYDWKAKLAGAGIRSLDM